MSAFVRCEIFELRKTAAAEFFCHSSGAFSTIGAGDWIDYRVKPYRESLG
jgi:hypothetical protein